MQKNITEVTQKEKRMKKDFPSLSSKKNSPLCVLVCLNALKAGNHPPKMLSNMARAVEMWDTVGDWDE